MAEPHERRWTLAPEVAEPDVATFVVGQDDVGEGVRLHDLQSTCKRPAGAGRLLWCRRASALRVV